MRHLLTLSLLLASACFGQTYQELMQGPAIDVLADMNPSLRAIVDPQVRKHMGFPIVPEKDNPKFRLRLYANERLTAGSVFFMSAVCSIRFNAKSEQVFLHRVYAVEREKVGQWAKQLFEDIKQELDFQYRK